MIVKEVNTRIIKFELSVNETIKLYKSLKSNTIKGDIEHNIIVELDGILTSGDLCDD